MIWRRLRISGNISLATLHYSFQIVYGWDNDYLHQFHIYGKDYGIAYDGGLSFEDDSKSIQLDDFNFDVSDRFTYEYNFFKHWLIDIRIEHINQKTTVTDPPVCMGGNGMPGATKYDEYTKCYAILEEVIKNQEKITVGDVRNLLEELDAVRFNRKKSNQRLAALDLQNPTVDQVTFIG